MCVTHPCLCVACYVHAHVLRYFCHAHVHTHTHMCAELRAQFLQTNALYFPHATCYQLSTKVPLFEATPENNTKVATFLRYHKKLVRVCVCGFKRGQVLVPVWGVLVRLHAQVVMCFVCAYCVRPGDRVFADAHALRCAMCWHPCMRVCMVCRCQELACAWCVCVRCSCGWL